MSLRRSRHRNAQVISKLSYRRASRSPPHRESSSRLAPTSSCATTARSPSASSTASPNRWPICAATDARCCWSPPAPWDWARSGCACLAAHEGCLDSGLRRRWPEPADEHVRRRLRQAGLPRRPGAADRRRFPRRHAARQPARHARQRCSTSASSPSSTRTTPSPPLNSIAPSPAASASASSAITTSSPRWS